MHYARVQHVRQAYIGGPGLLRSYLRIDDGILEGFSDDCVLAYRLHRRIALDGQSKDAGEVSLDRNGELQLLILDEVAVGNAFAASRDQAVFDGEFVLRQ